MNDSLLFYAAVMLLPLLLLTILIVLVLITARLRAMHQEMIDTHETLKKLK